MSALRGRNNHHQFGGGSQSTTDRGIKEEIMANQKINTNPASLRFSLPFHGGTPTQALRQGNIRTMTEAEWIALNPYLESPRLLREMVNPGKQAPPHGMRAVRPSSGNPVAVSPHPGHKGMPRTY